MPTVHMIHGYLGAGKTTFARRLEQELPAIRFTHDEWMARLYGIDPPVEHFADCGSGCPRRSTPCGRDACNWASMWSST
jgi:predicted kinase